MNSKRKTKRKKTASKSIVRVGRGGVPQLLLWEVLFLLAFAFGFISVLSSFLYKLIQ